MKKSMLIFCLFVSFSAFGQLYESFSDGNFTVNPSWTGTASNFKVNSAFQLQSAASTASVSWLFTPSAAIENAVWECTFRIDYSTSSSNFACMYLVATAELPDPAFFYGYYGQIVATADEVSFYRKQGSVKEKLIDGTDKRTDGKTVQIRVRVTRDSLGTFRLFSKTAIETDFYFEGEVKDQQVQSSQWFGISFTNTATTGSLYFFDDIEVSGREVSDPLKPLLPGDVCFNELMFHHPDSSAEYIELYNRTDKRIDLSGLTFATRRSDGSVSTGTIVPKGITLDAFSCIALTSDSTKLRIHHSLPDTANIVQCGWTNLNNEGATLLLLDISRTTVIDSVSYSARQHHVLIHDTKGVALEKMHPDLPSSVLINWHSASSASNYGTPGMLNSQFREQGTASGDHLSLAQDWFSPDNNGINDRCIIQYKMPLPGYMLRLAVCTPDGALWLQLLTGELLSSEGFFSWDGQNKEGRISPPGIYILVAELFHPEQGVTKCLKMPVLLTIR